MKSTTAKKLLLQNPAVSKDYLSYSLAQDISAQVISMRAEKGLSQHELAKLLNTKQPSIARLENGETLPSLSFLQKVAHALDVELKAPVFILKPRVVATQSRTSKIVMKTFDFLSQHKPDNNFSFNGLNSVLKEEVSNA